MDETDTGQTRRFQYDRVKLSLILLSSVVFVGFGYEMIFHSEPGEMYKGIPVVLAGWFVLVFFGFCAAVLVWKFRTAVRRDTLVLTPNGLTDHRTTAVEIPWRDILGLSVVRVSRSQEPFLRLEIDPRRMEELSISQRSQWLERALMPMMRPGVTVSTIGLDVGFAEFCDIVDAYWQSHRAAGSQPGGASPDGVGGDDLGY